MNVLSAFLSENLHNYLVVAMAILYAAAVLSVFFWPDPTRLAMAKDVGTTLMGLFGVVGAAHTGKAIWGTGNGDASKAQ